jgi:hypothetical protein
MFERTMQFLAGLLPDSWTKAANPQPAQETGLAVIEREPDALTPEVLPADFQIPEPERGQRVIFAAAAQAPEGGTLEPALEVDTPATDADLQGLESGYRYYFDITLDPAKGQTIETLEQAFVVAGFDRHRPRIEMMDAGIGCSYWPKPENGTAHVYIWPHEAQSLRQQGYKVDYDASSPRPRVVSMGFSVSAPQ